MKAALACVAIFTGSYGALWLSDALATWLGR